MLKKFLTHLRKNDSINYKGRELMFDKLKNKTTIVKKTLGFCYFLFHEKIFGVGNTLNILKILQLYLSFECDYCSDKLIMNRDKYKSAALFSVLVNEYLKNRSEVTLSQLLSVLKEEFIKRDIDGRK